MALQVLDYELQKQLIPLMKDLHPLPGIYDPSFIAANQDARADNLIKGSKRQQMETVREQIREFKAANSLDQVIVLWTANTERYSEVCLPAHACLRRSRREGRRSLLGCRNRSCLACLLTSERVVAYNTFKMLLIICSLLCCTAAAGTAGIDDMRGRCWKA